MQINEKSITDTSHACNTTRHPGYNGNTKFTCTDMNWIPVKDKLPKMGQIVLFCGVVPDYLHDESDYMRDCHVGEFNGKIQASVYNPPYPEDESLTMFYMFESEGFRYTATHWMPLPQPPK